MIGVHYRTATSGNVIFVMCFVVIDMVVVGIVEFKVVDGVEAG